MHYPARPYAYHFQPDECVTIFNQGTRIPPLLIASADALARPVIIRHITPPCHSTHFQWKPKLPLDLPWAYNFQPNESIKIFNHGTRIPPLLIASADALALT